MVTTSIVKTKFLQLNDKRFYFPYGILSLPFGHPSFKELDEFKNEKGQRIEEYFWEEKEKLLAIEKTVLQNTPRLRLFDKILNQQPKIVDLNQVPDFEFLYPQKIKKNIKNIVLSGEWMK